MDSTRLPTIPDEFLSCGARDIRRAFPEPTLVHAGGPRSGQPLVVSILLHGNETSSVGVAQSLCRLAREATFRRPLWILVGNVRAAEAGVRSLPGQPDFNRIWSGGSSPECGWAQSVLAELRESSVYACVDVHNNTGKNPPYGCVPGQEGIPLALATRFAPDVVHLGLPLTTLTHAAGKICPALTLECGQAGDKDGIARALALIESLATCDRLPEKPRRPFRLYGRCRRLELPAGASVAFGETGSRFDFVFPVRCEQWNFSWLAPGTIIGRRRPDGPVLQLRDESAVDVASDWLDQTGADIKLKKGAAPAMLTCDPRAVALDCVGYLMDRLKEELE